MPHNITGLLFQSTIAILILVGFASSTALGAEAKNPKRDIPRGVLLSLVIQGLFAYLLEYFAANYALSDKLVSADGKLTGIAAAGASGAPIGDMAIQIGNAFLSAIIGTIGVLGGVMALTGITLASNLGTFILYALICGLTVVAFGGGRDFNLLKHGLIPTLGLAANIVMVLAIFIVGIHSGGITAQATYLALAISAGWLALSLGYFVVSSLRTGRPILAEAQSITHEDNRSRS